MVLFHGGFGCPGGYVGVDMFFVISGFLITSLIWKDLESGCFTFGQFWERRARRIVPAMVVVTLATLVAGWFLMLPRDFRSLGQASASQAVFGANIYYWKDSGYFSRNANEKPLLHTWSLAVEEQFYIIVPFLFWGMYRAAKLRTRKAVLSLLSAGFIVSFALSVYGVALRLNAAFYLLPCRAWELSLGSIVAFLPPAPGLLCRRFVREFFALTGLTLILVPVFMYGPKTPFPGVAALSPCLGVALLIWANEPVANCAPTTVGTLLATRSIVFVGLISYSLYLWHLPFLAFSHYLALEPVSAGQRVTMLGLGLGLAVLSWKYVETPFRKRTLAGSRKSMFVFAGSGIAAVLGCGLLCWNMQGFPQRLSSEAQEFSNAEGDSPFYFNLTTDDIRAGRLVPIGATDSTLRPTVLVWGDSHGNSGLEEGSIAYNDAVISYIQSQHIPDVVLIARWGGYPKIGGNSQDFNSSLLATVRRLVAMGSRPWIMLDVPNHSFDVPRALCSPIYSVAYIESHCAKPTAWNEFSKKDPEIVAQLESAGGRILEPKPRFLDPTGQRYIIQAAGIALYGDNHHLTTKGSRLMLLPFLRDSLTLDEPSPPDVHRVAAAASFPRSMEGVFASRKR
ncbi:MAG: acyltransferase [Candidatus Hydrogenedentes bacterium]|nr:acyltransferase [Candidatus Hydrogenedentota bacterium]